MNCSFITAVCLLCVYTVPTFVCMGELAALIRAE